MVWETEDGDGDGDGETGETGETVGRRTGGLWAEGNGCTSTKREGSREARGLAEEEGE